MTTPEQTTAPDTRSQNQVLRDTTRDYLSALDPTLTLDQIEQGLLAEIATYYKHHNETYKKERSMQWAIPKTLTPSQVGDIMLTVLNIRTILMSHVTCDDEQTLLAIYDPTKGIYTDSYNTFVYYIRSLNYQAGIKFIEEVIALLKTNAKQVYRTEDPDLIALNNGIFNYKTKKLQPFSPNYVYLAKSAVNFNPHATNPVINENNDVWDVETWLHELNDDPAKTQLLWQIMGAVIRPHVPWAKTAFFYSTVGNNGKGTLCVLMRNLCGPGAHTSIPLASFGEEFLLEPLKRVNTVITDENDVGSYIDKGATLKAIITNDVFLMNRKHKTPIPFQFNGFMIQCINELPRMQDKSDSMYRRYLFVEFNKSFTGKEKKYIREDYLYRQDVLEYVVKKLLLDMPEYMTLSEPEESKQLLSIYKSYNDPVRQFLDDILEVATWQFLPNAFLYDCYKEWMTKNIPSGKKEGKTKFLTGVSGVLKNYENWEDHTQQNHTPVTIKTDNINYMNGPEYLVQDYGLYNAWGTPSKTQLKDRCLAPDHVVTENKRMRGILRRDI